MEYANTVLYYSAGFQPKARGILNVECNLLAACLA